ncbi:hypothetical protein J416_06672 [Gracilibacillus halophilus YIM-C55.5]|uniref:YugN-like family protein n=1 Tax=Gracilibacillus halophilus YIM-C55.5 TaxID=1308866 RepID=N4WLU0_9BACI|nr:YugN family protein [Gracilibacillus halophilus]ENH97112.1 hypothetical protein J416_06672 [Gracilibacillus halophilus YIM-C55.5]
MYPLESSINEKVYPFTQLQEKLETYGMSLGGAWEYDHGYFDLKLADDGAYHFLRIPFRALQGSLDEKEAMVQIDQPYLLSHRYKNDVDAYASSGALEGAVNQFQTPVEKDADIPHEYIEKGKEALQRLEGLLIK